VARGEGEVPGVSLRQGEMSSLDASERYDGAFCWGNSFGYLRDADTRAFVARVERALRPGARFVLETGAIAENVLAAIQPRTELSVGGYDWSLPPVAHLGAGWHHSCALLEDGTVQCWGDNTYGILGDGTTTASLVPVTVSGLANVVQITVGDYHSCALLADHRVVLCSEPLTTTGLLPAGAAVWLQH